MTVATTLVTSIAGSLLNRYFAGLEFFFPFFARFTLSFPACGEKGQHYP